VVAGSGVGVAVITTTIGVGVGPVVGGAAGVSVASNGTVKVALGLTVGLAVALDVGAVVEVGVEIVWVGTAVAEGVTPARRPPSPPVPSMVLPATTRPMQQAANTRPTPPITAIR
jgi:hypothetical protein